TEHHDVERLARPFHPPYAQAVAVAGLGVEPHHGRAVGRLRAGGGPADLRAERSIQDLEVVPRAGRGKPPRGNALAVPRTNAVVDDAGPPFVVAVAAVVKRTAPVPAGGVARAGHAEHVARLPAGADDLAQRFMDGAATFAIAPARHDDGARDNL